MAEDQNLDEIIDETPEVEEEPTPEIVEEQPEPEKAEAEEPKEKMVPLAALQEERAKRQAYEQIYTAQVQGQPQPEPVRLPDPVEYPAEYQQALQEQNSYMMLNTRLDMSENMARMAHGDEVVNAALHAAQQAGVVGQFQAKRHPWGELVKWHEQHQALAEIGDPKSYRAKIEAEIRAEMAAEQVTQQIKAPPSMASETSISGRAPQAADFTPLDELL